MTSPSTDRQNARVPVALIITGPPASGKTTLGRQLARQLELPFLGKDVYKEILFDHLGWSDREWSRRLGAVSMDLLYRSAAAVLEAGQSVALEANFYAEWDTPKLLKLAEMSECRFAQVVCSASNATLEERYRRRIVTGERHPGHTESEDLEETLARLFTGRWEALALEGPVIRVDTETLPSPAVLENIVGEVRRALGVECQTN
ncbi:MAG: ATP-binding protein [Chloroflexi bacterium]|nr:ATP-binding protein [Chloroflexota bacterium]